ncbi:ABC transporter substrate-binding protein [Thermodesulfobacteriota bacterium]
MFRFFSYMKFILTMGKTLMLVTFLFALLQVPVALAQSIEDSAKREGKLTLYVTSPIPNIQTYAAAFTKKYPFIRVEYFRTGASKLLMKVMAEKAGGKPNADFIQINGGLLGIYKKKGLLTKYVSPESRFYPEEYKDPEGFSSGLWGTYKLFVYNTKMVNPKEVPKTFEDLLDPKWKRMIAMDRNEFEWYMGMLDFMGEERGRQFMKRLGDQEIRVYTGTTLVGQLLAAGEFPLALSSQHVPLRLIRMGGPVGWLPSLTAIVVSRYIGIAADAPHPNAAKLMVNFLLSTEGQNVVSKMGRISNRPGVKKDPAIEALGLKLYPLIPKSLEQTEGFMKEFRRVILKR